MYNTCILSLAAMEAEICLLTAQCADFVPASLFSAYHLVQAGVTHISSNPSVFQKIYKVNEGFVLIDIVSIIWAIGKLLSALDHQDETLKACRKVIGKAKVFSSDVTYEMLTRASKLNFKFLGSLGAWAVLACCTVALINKCYKRWQGDLNQQFLSQLNMEEDFNTYRKKKAKMDQGKLNLTYQRPFNESFKQFLYVTNLALNVALIFTSQAKGVFIFNVLALSYSLLKRTSWKWIQVINTFDADSYPHLLVNTVSKAIVVYFALLLPYSGEEEMCSVCMEKTPESHFCANHAFCNSCLVRIIDTKIETKREAPLTYVDEERRFVYSIHAQTVLDGISYQERNVYKDNIGVIDHITYKVAIPKDNLPCCPLCRDQPLQGEFVLSLYDYIRARNGTFTSVKLVENV
jgi:hypothetical protein